MAKKGMILVLSCFLIGSLTTCQETTDIVKSNNEFSFSIFNKISKYSYGNEFLSPLSISIALSMAYDGADGTTADEMKKVLHFNKSQKETHIEYSDLLKYYNSLNGKEFSIANAVVTQKDYKFKSSYLKGLKDYNAIFKQGDFSKDGSREQVRNEINKWVSDNTNNKIEGLIERQSLSDLTKLVLLNANYFKADWKYKINKDRTQAMIFYGLENTQYKMDFMNSKERYKYYEDENLRMLEMPYENDRFSLYLIQPSGDKDFNNFCQTFSYNDYLAAENLMGNTIQINLFVPKFELSTKYYLKNQLSAMGMPEAFSTKANFKNMTSKNNLLIDNVIHQAFFKIDETGSEASSATAVIVNTKSAMISDVRDVAFNNPFIFLIKDNEKKSFIFVGKFTKPY